MGLKEMSANRMNQESLFNRFTHLSDILLKWNETHHDEVLIIWDQNNEICFSSDSIKRLFGYEPEEIVGNKWTEYVDSTTEQSIKNYLRKEANEPVMFYVELIHKDKRPISVESQLNIIEEEKTKSPHVACFIRKFSKIDATKERMVFSEKMSVLGQLTAGVAHEIRNPLTSIKGFLQLLQAGVEYKEEYYKIMIDEIEKMEKITSELLYFAKPMTDDKKHESIQDMLHDVTTLLHSEATLKNIEIRINVPTSMTLFCNRSQMKQVLINLVKNAIESMEEAGTIQINVFSQKGKINIQIKDEGVGFPSELAKRLEEPFFTTKENGTGLGLMITKQILDQHEASMSMVKNVDKGSTFCLEFPEPGH